MRGADLHFRIKRGGGAEGQERKGERERISLITRHTARHHPSRPRELLTVHTHEAVMWDEVSFPTGEREKKKPSSFLL